MKGIGGCYGRQERDKKHRRQKSEELEAVGAMVRSDENLRSKTQ